MNQTKIQNFLKKTKASLVSNQSRSLYSSFIPNEEIRLDRIRNIWLKKLHKLNITENVIENIYLTPCEIPVFQSPITALTHSNEVNLICTNFLHSIFNENHDSHCELFRDFKLRFPSAQKKQSNWQFIFEETLIKHQFPSAEIPRLLEQLEDFDFSTGIMKNFENIKNQERMKLFVFKRYACFLRFIQKLKLSSICQVVPLTRNQIKKAFECFRKGLYNNPFEENRGKHKKIQTLFSSDMFEWLKHNLETRKSIKRLYDIISDFDVIFPNNSISYSTFNRTIRQLGYRFCKVKDNPPGKNEAQNKNYRFWFVHSILKQLNDNNILVSIDESSFSGYQQKTHAWLDPNSDLLIENGYRTNSTNISLLLACSQEKILGYYIVEGAIDAVIYVDFLNLLENSISITNHEKRRVFMIMDNAKIHRNLFVKNFLSSKCIEVIFTPTYSPEIHFIEFIFARIKAAMKRSDAGSKKLFNKV